MKNFKVKCVDSACEEGFTSKKTYLVKNGKLIDEDGDRRPMSAEIFESVEDINRFFDSCFELVEESKMFTKDDLQVNDWVILRIGGIKRIAEFFGERHIIGSDFWIPVSKYQDSLKLYADNSADWDIMKVYRPTSTYMLKEEAAKRGKLIFDREKGIGCEPSVREISVDEAARLLTEKFGKTVRIRVAE